MSRCRCHSLINLINQPTTITVSPGRCSRPTLPLADCNFKLDSFWVMRRCADGLFRNEAVLARPAFNLRGPSFSRLYSLRMFVSSGPGLCSPAPLRHLPLLLARYSCLTPSWSYLDDAEALSLRTGEPLFYYLQPHALFLGRRFPAATTIPSSADTVRLISGNCRCLPSPKSQLAPLKLQGYDSAAYSPVHSSCRRLFTLMLHPFPIQPLVLLSDARTATE
ncbi:hypothetical protein BJX61DRAFT_131502 [Aspergillus egyptiacus]|nr:hypothetical protein BJX61DRAFT_131502 [Aspergillus egyptiacus]